MSEVSEVSKMCPCREKIKIFSPVFLNNVLHLPPVNFIENGSKKFKKN
jgi:hypothetical protein